MNYSSNKNNWQWHLFVAALCFAVLRNISYYYLIVIPLLAFAIIANNKMLFLKNSNSLFYSLFILWTFFIAIFSPLYNPDSDVFAQVPRLFFATLTPFVFLFVSNTESAIVNAFRIFIGCYILAVLSYLFQINYGAIQWFSDEPMERGTVLRYATNLGSGNIYGIGLASAILACLFFVKRNFLKFIFLSFLMLGAILSMQKATIVNVFLAFMVYFLIIKKTPSILTILSSAFLLLCSYIYYSLYPNSIFSSYILEFINNGFGIDVLGDGSLRRDTVLSQENLWDRFAGIHVESIFEQHPKLLITLVGIGITGAGGGMGLPHYLQAHSTYWDIFFMGGIPYFFIVTALLVNLQISLMNMKDNISRFLFFSNIIICINMLASSALIYHPILSLPLWLSVGWVMRGNNSIFANSGAISAIGGGRSTNLL